MTDPAVAVQGLTKLFPVPFHRQSVVGVRDLDLRVEQGEVYGLLGPCLARGPTTGVSLPTSFPIVKDASAKHTSALTSSTMRGKRKGYRL